MKRFAIGALIGAIVFLVAVAALNSEQAAMPCLYGVMIWPDSITVEWTPGPICDPQHNVLLEQHHHSSTSKGDCMWVFVHPAYEVPVVDTLPRWCPPGIRRAN